MKYHFVLASNSPRRRQLLALFGWEFSVAPAEIDETPLPDEDARSYVLRLAEGKARAVGQHAPPESLVIAADTTVVDQGAILGKPVDARQAVAMLEQLRGRIHQVYTALAVLRVDDGTLLADLGVTDVPMRPYSDAEIQAYVATGDPLDKAGAYAIQHAGFNPVVGLQGCYANVVGLPLCHLTRQLRKVNVTPQVEIPAACQVTLNYRCPVFEKILGFQSPHD